VAQHRTALRFGMDRPQLLGHHGGQPGGAEAGGHAGPGKGRADGGEAARWQTLTGSQQHQQRQHAAKRTAGGQPGRAAQQFGQHGS
jgi:hypothetical protein